MKRKKNKDLQFRLLRSGCATVIGGAVNFCLGGCVAVVRREPAS